MCSVHVKVNYHIGNCWVQVGEDIHVESAYDYLGSYVFIFSYGICFLLVLMTMMEMVIYIWACTCLWTHW